jgi:hypothetical protein
LRALDKGIRRGDGADFASIGNGHVEKTYDGRQRDQEQMLQTKTTLLKRKKDVSSDEQIPLGPHSWHPRRSFDLP